MFLVFPENLKSCQNHGLFEGAIKRRCRWFRSRTLCKFSGICFTKQIMCLPFMYCPQLKLFRKQHRKKIYHTPLVTSYLAPDYKIFIPGYMYSPDIFCVKNSAILKIWIHINWCKSSDEESSAIWFFRWFKAYQSLCK